MAAPMLITRVIQLGSKVSLLGTCERLTRVYSCTVPRRSYYDYEYDADLPKDLESDVRRWSQVKNTLGPSPLREAPWPREEWAPKSRRCGLLAVKLGMVPLWTKSGERLTTTALQVIENNVIRYIPPEENKERSDKYGSIVIGARNADPLKKPLDYSEQFKEAGVPVKDRVTSFNVTSNAKIQPGMPLVAAHFRPGMYVDCCGKTIDKGFQGVMKRWGMKGQPASHGATKTHRRMGGSGGGGSPGRIWPGKKMPGQMGNKMRWTRGLKIWRINTKHNILYIGGSLAGRSYGYVKIMDSILPKSLSLRSEQPFPTFFGDQDLDEDLYDDDLFQFTEQSVAYEEDKET